MYFENELLKYQSNLKNTWQIIDSAINKKPNKLAFIDSLIVNGTVTSEPQLMANSFNKFFTSMPAKIVSEIAPVDPNNIPPFSSNFFSSGEVERDIPLFNMTDIAVSPQDIIDAINNLQPKLSLDMCCISLHFIKKFVPALVNP
jgi:Ni,Fe-hydrogenase III small subunit